MRGWLGAEDISGGDRKLFRAMDNAGAVWRSQLERDPNHEEALQRLDRLLWRALLEDLYTPPPGGFLPGRRRRTGRPVVLVELPPPGTPGNRAAERFLRSVHEARTASGSPGPLIIAVGQPSQSLLADLGNPEEITFSQAGQHLRRDNTPPVLVPFTEQAMAEPGLTLRKVSPKKYRFSRALPIGITAGLTTLVMVAAGLTVHTILFNSCVGGTGSVADGTQTKPTSFSPDSWFKKAKDKIEEQNKEANKAIANNGSEVRTVVAFVSNPSAENDIRYDGAIPELQGIAMWQKELLDNAVDKSRILLRVEVQETGPRFMNAEGKAKDLVRRLKREIENPPQEDYRKVVGVLGFAQSREETRAALKVLSDAKIPTIGTTATADEMVPETMSSSYRFSVPTNRTEARIMAHFAEKRNIVAISDAGDRCTPARQAIIVESSGDLYSESIAAKFRNEFHGTKRSFALKNKESNFKRNSDATPISTPKKMAEKLCTELKKEPKSVVYWSARTSDFVSVINELDTSPKCNKIENDITILGGNELTNVAQTGRLRDKDRIRLYYSAHRLPGNGLASNQTIDFVDEYKSTWRTAPWAQDSHAAVSYDAFQVLSRAVDESATTHGGVEREYVLGALDKVAFNGATGHVSYESGNAAPTDKTLVLLRQVGQTRKVVLVCGKYDGSKPAEVQGPCAP
ncbi:ABC transporter substrate-binding protein [Actinomadura sp. CNU-125]|uniref:ABC transporter substrate-binding protein n=1 Tax=Actinomadura sp. CNU-125 TaxID=1904961 RepID=UPI001177F605|nr:ABC transporter substrate-binding protein [Actinomadura sp. CNU-125]